MPKKTPRKRKERSGASKRAAKKRREDVKSDERAKWKALYEEIGPPPAKATERIEWGSRLGALVTWEAAIAPEMREPSDRRQILDGVRTLSLTGVKALYQQDLRELREKVYGRRKGSDGTRGLKKYEPPRGGA